MKFAWILVVVAILSLSGCASTPTVTPTRTRVPVATRTTTPTPLPTPLPVILLPTRTATVVPPMTIHQNVECENGKIIISSSFTVRDQEYLQYFFAIDVKGENQIVLNQEERFSLTSNNAVSLAAQEGIHKIIVISMLYKPGENGPFWQQSIPYSILCQRSPLAQRGKQYSLPLFLI